MDDEPDEDLAVDLRRFVLEELALLLRASDDGRVPPPPIKALNMTGDSLRGSDYVMLIGDVIRCAVSNMDMSEEAELCTVAVVVVVVSGG